MHDETVAHVVSECPKPAQKEYSPNNTAKVIHWKLCGKCGFPSTQNGICISQSKHWSQKSVKYCEIFRYREVNNWSIIGQILPWLTRKKTCQLTDHHALWLLYWKERKRAKIIVTEVWNQTHLEDEKGKTMPVIIDELVTILKDFNRWMEKMELDLTVEML